MTSWYESLDNIVTLCRYLVGEHGFSADELLAVIEEPWHWREEFLAAIDEESAA